MIDTSEGGEHTTKRLADLTNHLNNHNCSVSSIKTTVKQSELPAADLFFSPLKTEFSNKFQQIVKLQVINDTPLSSSIVVRGATGVDNIKALADVHIAFLSKQSVTGYQLAQQIFQDANVVYRTDKTVFTKTNLGAMSLLLHKDVFAAVIATPLAEKWSKANDLKTIAKSDVVQAGGLYANKQLNQDLLTNCQQAFIALSEPNRKNKKLRKVFPEWVIGLKSL